MCVDAPRSNFCNSITIRVEHIFSPPLTPYPLLTPFTSDSQVAIVSSYPVRPTTPVRTWQSVWRSPIRPISLWVSAVVVKEASQAPAVRSMRMNAAPTPAFTASAMTVRSTAHEHVQ